jgi:hypothetical protein
MKIYQFNNILPSPPSFFISYVPIWFSSLFMSISNLILLYNMKMKKANIFSVIFWKDFQKIIISVTSKIRTWVRWDGFRVQNSSRPTKIDSGLESASKLRITEWTLVEVFCVKLCNFLSLVVLNLDAGGSRLEYLDFWSGEIEPFSCTVEMELRPRWELTLSFLSTIFNLIC